MRRILALVAAAASSGILAVTPLPQADECLGWDDPGVIGDTVVVGVENGCNAPPDTGSDDGVFADPGTQLPPDITYHGCDPRTDPEQCAWQEWIEIDLDPYNETFTTDPVVITTRDVAHFKPSASELIIEPNGWGIVNRPVNVFTDAAAHTTSGTVLGRPVTISWVPVSFTVDYGDGTTITHADPGESWAEGEPWAHTDTSHVYTDTGDFVVRASVEYAAVVHIGDTTIPVQGTVSVDSGDETVSIYWVKTRLVRGDCIDYPLDPGCETP